MPPKKATKKPAAKKASPKKHKGDVEEVAPPAKKAKGEPDAAAAAAPAAAAAAGSDPLELAKLFDGSGYGSTWEAILRPVIEAQPRAAQFIGPARSGALVPVRELTFQSLKPNPPGGWRVVSLGQSPFPRVESATGIAHFDSRIESWEDKTFGKVVTMRCLIKAAAMHKYGMPKSMKNDELRKLLKEKNIVGPAEWFQAMLAQGVLFMNAALTLAPPKDTTVRASQVVRDHTVFWTPVVETVLDAILTERTKQGEGVVFAWWGAESLKTKKMLAPMFKRHPKAKIAHVDHKNPAAMYDSFCDPPSVFGSVNGALEELGLGTVDWLPTQSWSSPKKGLGPAGQDRAEEMGAFIKETKELHEMFVKRLRDGLDRGREDLQDISIMKQPLVPLPDSVKPLGIGAAADKSLHKAKSMKLGSLTLDQGAAVHLYTTNAIYKNLNAALRAEDRKQVQKYLLYLRLFCSALQGLDVVKKPLYRGVALDLSKQYQEGSTVTWWAVSSCTPKLSVATGFSSGTKSTLFVITPLRSVSIRHLSAYTHEEEYILAPGTQFRVAKSVKKSAGVYEIHLEELEGPTRVA